MDDIQQQQACQLMAATVLGDLLSSQNRADAAERLPLLRWTIKPDGSLHGEPAAALNDTATRAAVQAWADHLGLPMRSARLRSGRRLTAARGSYERVEVTVSAITCGEG
jgi:hypothetical protein